MARWGLGAESGDRSDGDLAVNGIKIDSAFTRAIGTDSVTVGILPQILAMAEVLKLSVGEGVETEAQDAYFGTPPVPRTGQGWLFGYPVPTGEFRELWLASGLIVRRSKPLLNSVGTPGDAVLAMG